MDTGALEAVRALEAALGEDPCDVDGGCGTYQAEFFNYDIDSSGTIELDEVFDSPFDALEAIQAEHGDIGASVIVESGSDYHQNSTNEDGEALVNVYSDFPISVIIVTLADYPIDKHGENKVCVEHEIEGRKGDFNGDGHINFTDFVYFGIAYNSHCGDPNYNPIFDFNDDCAIGFTDFVFFGLVYGT